ncbi:coatomer subunit gamma-2-like [Tigriopus californicus]|uniref:coatomer subunit gamma-2-like n=1 Tax=Tigriopus californicus TaxID=6832 RepID=UPI0027DA98FC|nr:coatomer subunit gamma-2-like [Tigriopus californicus]
MYASFRKDKKDEEEGGSGMGGTGAGGGSHAFAHLEKTSVLQEARLFNATPVNPRKCTHILAKILYLLQQGESVSPTEATETFFAITKLFQCPDPVLRRMVYLGIKGLSNLSDDVIIVTSSLTKDMTGKEDAYRAAAIRALCTITDATMLQAIERYMKQALVERSPAIASAALVSAWHMGQHRGPGSTGPDVVKRWVNEAQEAVSSDSIMVQYHALGLLYHIRRADRLAVTKLVSKLTRSSLKSPYAVCLLIRIACQLIEEDADEAAGSSTSIYFDFVESCIRHKSEMVIYEAAHAIVNMRRTTNRELVPAISVLQLFCSSPKATLRFAAVRTLNQVSMTHPAAVTACNLDLENLITDSNRSIATLAITTLLKTGAESSVDRLMKQIASFVSEISDEFKVVVVQAIKSLCLKFPRKHGILMNFLSGMLRDEGGLEYKTSIADTIITIIEENPEAKENGLAHLCEFIEDCEHTTLAVRILHLLGAEGPRTSNPNRYIRYIYNRVILENATVRAAAVSALARFGALCDDLLPNVLVLLSRCQMDNDDEVRDRATYFKVILEQQQQNLNSQFILNGLQVSLSSLEKALHNYTLSGCDAPFDIKSVPAAPIDVSEKKAKAGEMGMTSKKADAKPTATRHDMFVEKFAAIPQIAQCGPLFRSSQPVELTESETEYVVQCIKHVFPNHVVLQFDCTNTLNDQLLEKVTVDMEIPDGFELVEILACNKLEYNVKDTIYAILASPEDELSEWIGTVSPTLKFVVKDCDPNTGEPDSDEGYPDEYVLEDLELSVSDYVQRAMKANFPAAWEELGPTNELEDTYVLSSMKTLDEAVKSIIQFLGMQPCERSDKVPEGKSSHTLVLAGVFRGGHDILVRAKLALSEGVTMQLTVRSENPDVSELITATVG